MVRSATEIAMRAVEERAGMTQDAYETAAAEFEEAARELELAVQHLRTTARHFREHNVPRACAHAFAVYGHMLKAQQRMEESAIAHADKSIPD